MPAADKRNKLERKPIEYLFMAILEIKGDWNIAKGMLKQKWAKLTDDDLHYAEGQEEELLGRIQKRTGETRKAVEKAIKESCALLIPFRYYRDEQRPRR